ncbi:hypothetical protein CsSME_00030236 [Camellia sinensis var. sinensis]
MNKALDLCEKGLRIVKWQDKTLALKTLRSKMLRFIAASHLQRDEFASVLKSVRVLRDGGGGGIIHCSHHSIVHNTHAT